MFPPEPTSSINTPVMEEQHEEQFQEQSFGQEHPFEEQFQPEEQPLDNPFDSQGEDERDEPEQSQEQPSPERFQEPFQQQPQDQSNFSGHPYPHFEDISLPLNDESVLPPQQLKEIQEEDEEEEENGPRPPLAVTPNLQQVDGSSLPPAPRSPAAQSHASDGGFGRRGHGGGPGGFTLRNLEEENNKLKKDNLSLKLRIYLLEEKYGLAGRPQEKENVFKINIDLEVQNETMKKELQEKTDLLREAYNNLLEQEQERLREKTHYESQIESLKVTMDSQLLQLTQKTENNQTGDDHQMPEDGSLSCLEVGDRSRALLFDAFGSMNLGKPDEVLEKMEELQQELSAKGRRVKEMEEEMAEKEEEVKEMQEAVEAAQAVAAERAEDLKKEGLAINKLTKQFQDQIKEQQDLIKELEDKTEREKEGLSRLNNLAERRERDHLEFTTTLHDKITELEREKEAMAAELTVKTQELEQTEEKLVQTQMCVKKVAESNLSVTKDNERMENEIRVRDQALEKLKEQYEILKAKVRKYRAQGRVSGVSEDSQAGQQQEEVVEALKQREVDLLEEVRRLKEQVRSPSSPSHDQELEREIERLNSELKCCKASSMHAGAKMAMDKASEAYSEAVGEYTVAMQGTLDHYRQTLVSLIKFLEYLISMEGDGLLNFSGMSVSMREALHKSLDEGRRLSQSLSQSMMENVDETQLSTIEEIPQFKMPVLEINFEGAAAEGDSQQELKERIKELEEKLREKEEYDTFAKPLTRSRSMSRRRNQEPVVPATDSDAWSQPDKTESRKRLGLQSKIPMAVRDSSQEDEEVSLRELRKAQAKVSQLQSRIASQEDKSGKEVEEAKQELAEALAVIAVLKKEKKALTEQLQQIKDELEHNVAALTAKLKEISRENLKLEAQLTDMSVLVREKEDLQHEILSEKEKVEKQKAKALNELDQSRMTLTRLQEEQLAWSERLEAEMLTKVRGLENKIKVLRKDKVASEEEHEKEMAKQSERITELETKNQEIRSEMSKLNTGCSHHGKGSSSSGPVLVSKENLEGQEVALGPVKRKPFKNLLNSSQGCDCQMRIEELERLLEETKALYEEAEEKMRREREWKEKVQKQAKVEIGRARKALHKLPARK